MRKLARTRPDIKIGDCGENTLAEYSPTENYIRLSPSVNAENVVYVLKHELTHWAQFMYCDGDDILDYYVSTAILNIDNIEMATSMLTKEQIIKNDILERMAYE